MRALLSGSMAGFLACLAWPAPGQGSAQQRAYCMNHDEAHGLALIIRSCTAIIQSGNLSQRGLAIAFTIRGVAYARQRNYDRATADYDQAIRIDPSYAYAYAYRGIRYAALGDHRRALASYREAARQAPHDAIALNGLCWGLAVIGEDLDQARAACDEALRIAPNDSNTLDSRGLVGLKQGRSQDAWRDYDAARRIDPRRASFIYGRGIAALRLGRAEEGRADIAAAIALEPAIAQTYASYGIAP